MSRMEPRPPPSVPDIRGRHRRLAEVTRLEQEIRILEEELEKLNKTEKASTVCKEVALMVEKAPDPFLSITRGPQNPAWDRWFEGPAEHQDCGCCL